MSNNRKTFFKTCEYCKANLDPGEKCDCVGKIKDDMLDIVIDQMSDVQKEMLSAARKGHVYICMPRHHGRHTTLN